MKEMNLDELRRKYLVESKVFDEKLLEIEVLDAVQEELVDLVEMAKLGGVAMRFDGNEFTVFYLRKSVAEALMMAGKRFFELGFIMVVKSAYRSLEGQKELFKKRFFEISQRNPGLEKEELLQMANLYTAGIPILASHTAGAAVDVVLEKVGGGEVDFGVLYRHGDVEAVTDFPFFDDEVKRNRGCLKSVMEEFGFVNYPFEYWHFSIGDVCSAWVKGDLKVKFLPVEFQVSRGEFKVWEGGLKKFFDV